MKRFIFGMVLCALVMGCDNYPKDVENSLQKIRKSGILKVGVIEHNPWIYEEDGKMRGSEAKLVEAFSETLGGAPEWDIYPEAVAIKKLKNNELDLVAGGLTADSPRHKQVGFTRPYLKTGEDKINHHVLALQRGENAFLIELESFLASYYDGVENHGL